MSFGDLKEKKKNTLSDIIKIDISEQKGNLTPELSTIRKGKELLLKEEVH